MMKLPKYFPSISRRITEAKAFARLSNKPKVKEIYSLTSIFLSLVVIIILTILIGFLAFNFAQNYSKFQILYSQRQSLKIKINFWKSIADQYTGYPDAYFDIGLLYYQLGDFQNSRKYLDKTLVLNPDYQNAEKLDSSLLKKGY